MPGQLEGRERDLLCHGKARYRSQEKQEGRKGKNIRILPRSEVPPTFRLDDSQQGAARGESQKRYADNHVCEVIPLDNAKKPHENKLKGQGTRRDTQESEKGNGILVLFERHWLQRLPVISMYDGKAQI